MAMPSPRTLIAPLLLAAALVAGAAAPAHAQDRSTGSKVIQLPIRTDGPKSLDPVRGSTVYDNVACSQIYETLLEYKYLVRPLELQPLLLTEMPATPDGGKTWRFKLKPAVRFADDPCFTGGKGREITSADVFYSWKRLADDRNDPKGWWLFEDQIVGFDDYRKAQNAAAKREGKFDYDAPVPGLRILSPTEFEVELTRPVQQFLFKLAMFQTSVVAREAVDKYGIDLGKRPVGTGPFILDRWEPGKSLSLNRNPSYHQAVYPSELPKDEAEARRDTELGLTRPAGTRLPIPDRLEFTMFVQDEPMWLSFRAGKIGYTEVPSEYFEEAFNKRTRRLRPEYRARGIQDHANLLLDFIFDGFNMHDSLLGGYTDEKKALRQAISLALDYEEINQSFYNGICIVYDGPIPPGLDGHPKDGRHEKAYRGPSLDRAKALLAKAGYPDGKGLPPIDYYTSRGGNSQEQSEMRKRQLAAIGIQLNVNLVDFSELIERVNRKGAPMFSFSWATDYPDAENNLALFYGPFETPGSNSYNYRRQDYDALFVEAQTMPPGPERTALYEKMRDMVIEDCPYTGALARTRFYLINPWLKNLKPTEDFWNWYKYLDVDDSRRGQ
ncbi:MAG: ABC transporter substrate-binding protein [Phycisphaerales bacterium]